MIRKYTLYLDESGDFDGDLEIAWKNECLTGGLLLEEGRVFKAERARGIIVSAWKKAFPEDAKRSDEAVFGKAAHATELREKKARIVCSVLEEAEKYGEFVIFENYNKTRIVNSTLTYINIMADGIVQLAGRLVTEYPEDRVKLNVIAGFRKDTTLQVTSDKVEGYIGTEECVERIRERLSLARVKNHTVYNGKTEITFRNDDDKANPFLALCDYICNFYITRTAAVYRQSHEGKGVLREYLEGKYKPSNLFSLYGDAERERVATYINSQNYDAALYDICTGMVEREENARLIMKTFLRLPEKVRENYLGSLGNYFNNLIGGERNLTLGEKALKNAERIAEELREAGKEDVRFSLDVTLYRLAVCNHQGRIAEMEGLFGTCRELLRRALVRTEYLEYAFLYYNRYAVYLMDTFRVEEARELLEQTESRFAAYELILEELPGMRIRGEEIKSEQLGRILGTQVQCMRYLLSRGKCTYEAAVEISDRSIRNFSGDSDKMRQYQYRAQIEAVNGDYEEAKAYLCRGFGVGSLQEFFEPGMLGNSFALYQLSFFLKAFAHGKEMRPEFTEILKKLKNSESFFAGKKEYPEFVTSGNAAYAMEQSGFDANAAKRYYKSAIKKNLDAEGPLLFALRMMIQADYIAMLTEKNDPEAQAVKSEFADSCEKLGAVRLPKGMEELPEKAREACRQDSAEGFREFAGLRQY